MDDPNKPPKKGNPVGLFAEFWLDILLVIIVGFVFTQSNAASETVINTCRAIWGAFHTLYIGLYFRIRFSINRIEEEEVRQEEQAKLLQLMFSFVIKGLTTLGLHIATGLPQPLLMGGVVTTFIMSPFRRDYANSFIKKYVIGDKSTGSNDDDSVPPPRPSGVRASLLPPSCARRSTSAPSRPKNTAPSAAAAQQSVSAALRLRGVWGRNNIRPLMPRTSSAVRPPVAAAMAVAGPLGSVKHWVR